MKKENTKKLVGIETAGSMNMLFTDKTGTITIGEPKCERIAVIDAEYKSISSLKKSEKLYRKQFTKVKNLNII